jgi:hypothetical protein
LPGARAIGAVVDAGGADLQRQGGIAGEGISHFCSTSRFIGTTLLVVHVVAPIENDCQYRRAGEVQYDYLENRHV